MKAAATDEFYGDYSKWVSVILILLLLFCLENAVCFSRIETLPGFSGPLPFKLETGYIGVGENEDVQLFYYFIESERNPRDDPLVLWLNGGPGCSALSGLVLEIGPLRFNIVEYNGSLPTWVLNPYSWTKVSNIIFLDAPVGTGFSYSRSLQGYKSGDRIFATQTHDFMRKFLITHPEFSTNPFYVSGDSYVGLVIPVIVQEISEGNEAGQEPPINLKGYMLGNAVTDFDMDENSRIEYAHNMALISDELYESTKKSCKGKYVNVDPENSECAKDLQAVSECVKQINLYNILDTECINIFGLMKETENDRRYLQESYVESLFSLAELPKHGCRNYVDLLSNIWANDITVQDALGVRKGTIRLWDRCNRGINYDYEFRNVVEYHRNLTTRGYRALIYSGQLDMAVSFLATQSWIRSLNFPIVDHWRPWLVNGQVAGHLRVYANNLTYATVKGAGHTAPEDKPKECLAMYQRWLSQEPL